MFLEVNITDELPANIVYVPDSAVPAPKQTGNPLVWERRNIPAGAIDIAFRVRPQALGDHPTNARAEGSFVDTLGARGTFTFPVPMVHVRAETSTPTATPLPTPTLTPTAAPPTAVPSATRVPLPTATPPTANVCPKLGARVPAAAINQALANPPAVGGWLVLCNPNRPPGPLNGLRNWLSPRNPAQAFHPLFNGLEWKCGCR